jgi:hypothetical protein
VRKSIRLQVEQNKKKEYKMLVKVRSWVVLGLHLAMMAGSVHTARADGFMPGSMPNLEGAKYLCKGTGIEIEVRVKEKVGSQCQPGQCIYIADILKNGVLLAPFDEKGKLSWVGAIRDSIDSWAIFTWIDKVQLVSKVFGDETVAASKIASAEYPAVSCTLSLKP